MPEYYVFGLCGTTAGEAVGPYASELTEGQLRRRVRESFSMLKDKLARIPHIATITERPQEGAAFIASTKDVAAELKREGIQNICFDAPRASPLGARCLFYIRATLSHSPHFPEDATKVLEGTQQHITRIISEIFQGCAGPYPHTYFVPGEMNTRWLSHPLQRKNAWLTRMGEIEEAVQAQGISAEFGVWHVPEKAALGVA